ncbi:MAG: DUF5686 family protein [Crocinitomicaceae bacterium]
MKTTITTFVILLFCCHVYGQRQFSVKDETSLDVIPFVKVFPNVGNAFLCDLDGRFSLTNENITSVRLVYSGYKDTTYQLANVRGNELLIRLRTQEIQEVTVVPGVNPAHRIMDLVIANRKKNNPMDHDAFRYKSYSKVIADGDSTGLSRAIDSLKKDTLNSDSIQPPNDELEINDFLTKSHLFMIESTSIRTFVPPARDHEEIIAYKASGVSDPFFATFAKSLQSFSFYDNQFNIGKRTFINPIALGGTKRYLFILEDTTYVGRDTVFHIAFRPRKDKNFDGMEGTLYINTDGYAVEKVIATPKDPGSVFRVTIIQEYQKLEGKKWFPSKLSSEFQFPFISFVVGNQPVHVVGKSNTYIEEVEINPEKVKRSLFTNAEVEIAEGAEKKEDNDWSPLRKYELTEKEKNTYEIWDTLVKESDLDKKLYLAKVVLDGKIPMKYFNTDINRIVKFNHYEAFRVGLGAETSKLLFKPATLSGYFAYGTRDRAWKYGGFLDIHILPKKQFDLSLVYQQDVIERGGRSYLKDLYSMYTSNNARNLYANQMDSERLAKATLSAYLTGNFKMGIFASYSRIGFNNGYNYLESPLSSKISGMDVALFGAEISWRMREKIMIVGEKYVAISPTKFPILYVKAEQALSGIYSSSSTFSRIYTEIKQNITVRGVGEFVYRISAGKTFGDALLTYAQTMLNSAAKRVAFSVSVPNTFETLLSSSVYLQEQVSLFTRFNFNKWKSLSKRFQPQISLHHAVGFGNVVDQSNHFYTAPFTGLEKGYYEAGLLINDIIGMNRFSMGLGGFYNYGPYSQPKVDKNIFVKLTLGLIIE